MLLLQTLPLQTWLSSWQIRYCFNSLIINLNWKLLIPPLKLATGDSLAIFSSNHNANGLLDFKLTDNNQSVSVANGTSIPIQGFGRLNFLPDSTHYKALYIPYFPFNLLSVGKRTHALNCCIIFYPTSVQFQELTTGRKMHGWSHILSWALSLSTTQHGTSVSIILWIIVFFVFFFLYLLSQLASCDICQYFKQTLLQ